MAESVLGTAVLQVTADTRQARDAIEGLKTALSGGFNIPTPKLFVDLPQQAAQTGARAGAQLRNAVQRAATGSGGIKLPPIEIPDFSSIKSALDFSSELRASVTDLQAYKRVLESLRDTVSATDPLFKRLTSTIQASGTAIKDFQSGTGDLVESLARVKSVASGLTFDKQLAALRSLGSGFRSVTSAALEAAKAVASVSAKGAVETLKVPIFGLPKETTGLIEKARAQIQRLQKQAETSSGKVARLSEGVAALGVGGAAAKGVVDVLGSIGTSATDTAGLLAQVAQALNSLPGPLRGLGGLSDVFASGNESIRQFAANILQTQGDLAGLTAPLQTVSDLLTSLGPETAAVGGALAFTFAGFQDLINRSFQPGIDGARKALQGMTDDTQLLLEALSRASEASSGLASLRDLNLARAEATERAASSPVGSEENLQASQELVKLNEQIAQEKQKQFYLNQRLLLSEQERVTVAERFKSAAAPARQLALPSSTALEQRVAADGGIQPRRLRPTSGPAIDVGLQRGREFVDQLGGTAQTFRRLGLSAADTQSQIDGLPEIFNRVGQALEGFAGAVGAADREYRSRMEAVQRSLEALQKATEQAAQRRDAQDRAVAEFGASPITGRRADGTVIPGSPAAKREKLDLLLTQRERQQRDQEERERQRGNRRRRASDAIGSGLIGGAFPLLFGQGVGASVGGGVLGAAGGALGGQFGFGLSLIGTAVGQAFDQMIEKGRELAAALSDPIASFDRLKEAGLISGKGLEKTIASLIASGREAEAFALIQRDLSRFGDNSGLVNLSNAFDDLRRRFSELGISIAQFAAGPITDLLKKITVGIQLPLLSQQFNQEIQALTPEQQKEQRALLRQDATRLGAGTGRLVGEVGVEAYTKALERVRQIRGATGDQVRAQTQLVQAVARTEELDKLRYRQIDAQVQGNQRLSLELKKQQTLLERDAELAALAPDDPRRIDISRRAALELYRIGQEQRKDETQHWADSIAAANRIRSIQEQTAIESARPSLTGIGIGALQSLAQFRAAQGAERDAQARLRIAPSDPDLQNAAFEAAENVKAAAAKTKADLQEAFRAAQDAVTAISRSIEDATTSLQKQKTQGGLREFLSPQQNANLQEEVNRQLLPEVQALVQRLGNVGGAPINFSVTGTTEQRNAALLRLIDAGRQFERTREDLTRLQPDLQRAENDLKVVNEALVASNTKVATALPLLQSAIEQLVGKDWQVNVNVPGGSASGDVVGAVNGAF